LPEVAIGAAAFPTNTTTPEKTIRLLDRQQYHDVVYLQCDDNLIMRIVDFADMLQRSINEKIKECKDSIHKLHNPIYNKSLEVEIDTLEWVQGKIRPFLEKRKTRLDITIKHNSSHQPSKASLPVKQQLNF
jgi:hypothetical protein